MEYLFTNYVFNQFVSMNYSIIQCKVKSNVKTSFEVFVLNIAGNQAVLPLDKTPSCFDRRFRYRTSDIADIHLPGVCGSRERLEERSHVAICRCISAVIYQRLPASKSVCTRSEHSAIPLFRLTSRCRGDRSN